MKKNIIISFSFNGTDFWIEIDPNFILLVAQCLVSLALLLVAVAYFTLAERKMLASMQRRRGPNVIGFFGLLQPLADGHKLLVKEFIKPSSSNFVVFVGAPILTFVLSMASWVVIPFDKFSFIAEFDVSLLYIFSVSSLGVYGVIMSGWSGNSKYGILGALRSAAQMIAYEITIGMIVVLIAMCTGSVCVNDIIDSQRETCWNFITFNQIVPVMLSSALAETNRHPFDLPEAESELVAGFNVEYSGMFFALFSLGEYLNMLLMSAIVIILFFGGWLPPCAMLSFIPGYIWFSLKMAMMVFFFIVARGSLPRFRYDQLMYLGWFIFIPFTFGYSMFMFSIFYWFDLIP